MKPSKLLRSFLLAAGSSLLAVSYASAQSGTWNVDANGTWGTNTNWLSNTIADGSGNTANFTNNITGDRTVSLDGDRTLTNLVFSDSDTATAGSWILNNNGNSANNLILAGTTPTITVNALGTDKTATISAIIQGTVGMSKSGAGTLIITGDNTYTGNTTVSQGTLKITSGGSIYANAFTGSAVVTVQSGAVLELDEWNYSTSAGLGQLAATAGRISIDNGTIRMNGDRSYGRGVTVGTSGATFEAAAGANWTQGGFFDFTANSYGTNAPLTFTGAGNGRFEKLFSGGGSLTKSGTGTWTLSNQNTYTGATNISAGTLVIADTLATVNATAASDLLTLTQSGGSNITNSQQFVNGNTVVFGGTSVPGGLTAGTTYFIRDYTTNGTSSTFKVALTNGGTAIDLTSTGSAVSITRSGSLATSGIVLGDAATTTNNSSPTLLTSGAFTNERPITIANQATSGVYTIGGSNTSGTATYTGAITLNRPVTLRAATGGTVDFQSAFTTNNNAISIGSSGNTGTIRLTNTLSTSGGVNVNFGTLQLNTSDRLGDTTPVAVAGGTLALGANSDTVGAVTLTSGSITGSGGTLTGSSYDVRSGSASAILGGSGVGLTKTTGGTVTLTGVNTYSGNTTISGGALALSGSGSIANSPVIQINSSTSLNVTGVTGGSFTIGSTQTVGGTGSIVATGKTIVANGTLSPGNSPGAMIVDGGVLQLGVGGDTNMQVFDASGLAGVGYDTVNLINGASLDLSLLGVGSEYNINLWSLSGIGPDVSGFATNFDNTQNYSWTLFDTGSAISGFSTDKFTLNLGAFNGTDGFTNALGGGSFSVGLADSNSNLVVNFTAVPEPGAALIGSLGLLALLRRRRA